MPDYITNRIVIRKSSRWFTGVDFFTIYIDGQCVGQEPSLRKAQERANSVFDEQAKRKVHSR